jgi:hypothetical protein
MNIYRPGVVGELKKCVAGSGLYSEVDIRNVVDVPRETIASLERSGRARIVDGLSPVDAMIVQSSLKPWRRTKYFEIFPK